MGRILRLYAIREIVLPTLMALLTITFLLMIRSVYELIDLLLQPGIDVVKVVGVLASVLPSVLVFATPMAVLVGVLIGVGRMTLDREVLAIRSSGINLFSVFVPALVLAFIASLGIYWLSSQFVPGRMRAVAIEIGQLQQALINSLEPGRFYDDVIKDNAGKPMGVFYFEERTKDNRLKGVIVELDQELDSKDSASKMAAGMQAKIKAEKNAQEKPGKKPHVTAKDAKTTQTDAALLPRKSELTMVFAETAEIVSQQPGDAGKDSLDSEITLTLHNGSIHQLSADPARPDYTVSQFKTMERRKRNSDAISKKQHSMTNAELAAQIRDPKVKPEEQGSMRKELWQRRNMWLATFLFVLVGIPLAIWVRPSGKSWGILIAISLMLVYYIVLQMGLTMVQGGKTFGVAVSLLPNALFAALGISLVADAEELT